MARLTMSSTSMPALKLMSFMWGPHAASGLYGSSPDRQFRSPVTGADCFLDHGRQARIGPVARQEMVGPSHLRLGAPCAGHRLHSEGLPQSSLFSSLAERLSS